MRDARQDKTNLAVEPPNGSLPCIEMGIHYFQGVHEMCRCRFGTMVFVEDQITRQIMATRLHPIITRPIAFFVESQGGTYKGIREVMVLDTVKCRFHRVNQQSIFCILDIGWRQIVISLPCASCHYEKRQKPYGQDTFHGGKGKKSFLFCYLNGFNSSSPALLLFLRWQSLHSLSARRRPPRCLSCS